MLTREEIRQRSVGMVFNVYASHLAEDIAAEDNPEEWKGELEHLVTTMTGHFKSEDRAYRWLVKTFAIEEWELAGAHGKQAFQNILRHGPAIFAAEPLKVAQQALITWLLRTRAEKGNLEPELLYISNLAAQSQEKQRRRARFRKPP